jgi:hypothetical protein
VSRHAQYWNRIKLASMQAQLGDDVKYALVKEWARAFLEEVGDWAIAVFGKEAVRVSQLAENPEKYPDFVEFLFKVAGGGR